MKEAVKETLTVDGQKVLVEVKEGEMYMTIDASPYELFTIANQILVDISKTTNVDMDSVLDVLVRFNNNEEGK